MSGLSRGGHGGPVWPHCGRSGSPGESEPEHTVLRQERGVPVPRFSSLRSPASPGRSGLMGTLCLRVPRSRLVHREAGCARCHPGLRRGRLLLHGGLRSSRFDSGSELGRRCVGNAGPGMSVAGPRGPPARSPDCAVTRPGAAAGQGRLATTEPRGWIPVRCSVVCEF